MTILVMNGMNQIQVLLAEPHEIVREGYMKVLKAWRPDIFFDHSTNYGETYGKMADHSWDLVILELALPGRCGLELLHDMSHLRQRPRVLASSAYNESKFGVRALRSGAAGYVCKEQGVTVFIQAVDAVLGGRTYLSPHLAQSLVHTVQHSNQLNAHELLSDREFQVLRRLARGECVKEIAQSLCLSSKTVSSHRTHLMDVLNVKTLSELVQYCIKHELMED